MSNHNQNSLDEEFELLIRATRNELFHFISVQYNHYDLVRKVKHDLAAQYPNRPVHYFNLDNCNPDTFIKDILASKSGLVFIEKFNLIFSENFRSLCIGFNQRRDLFSTLPIQIIVFIAAGEENLRNFQKAMPDVFSIINPMIQLFQEIEISKTEPNQFENNDTNFASIEEANAEISRIKKRLNSLENRPENLKLIVSLKINLAISYRFIGAYTKAKALLESLLTELEANKILDFEEEIVDIQNDLGIILQDLEDYEGARQLLEKAVISAESIFGEKHPTTAATYSNLALVLKDSGNYEGAKKLIEKAITSYENNSGKNNPTTSILYSNLALVCRDLGDYEGAKKLIEKAMILVERNFSKNHPNTVRVYSNLALVYRDLGENTTAKELLEKAVLSNETNFGEKHPTTAIAYSNLAMVLKDLGENTTAKELLEKAYFILENHFGEKHPSTIKVKRNLNQLKEQMSLPR